VNEIDLLSSSEGQNSKPHVVTARATFASAFCFRNYLEGWPNDIVGLAALK
jgi:hypothetical protein